MPHISKLQDEYGEKVRIIGISKEKEDVVREWLPKEREPGVTWDQTVTYSLAMDTAESQMYETWFRAAGRTGIPSAFLVGTDGVIEWIGHPARIDEPLAKVIDGSWDRQAAIAAYEEELKVMKARAEAAKMQVALNSAIRDKDWDRALVLADEVIAKTPESPFPKLTKASVLAMSGNSEGASALVDELVKSDWESGSLLPTIATGIVAGRLPGSLDDAERLAKRAVEVIGDKHYSGRHALATVYAEKGQLDEAIAWERKALELNEANVVVLRALRLLEAKKEAAEKDAAAPEK
jgi:tetratricopeptide (TPR) repeat protein